MIKPFDPVTVSLEPGISLVEASAGTGKTYSIALTVIRLLLDQDEAHVDRVVGIGKVLVVTFTIAATDELITRVRAMLRDCFDVFRGVAVPTLENEALFRLLARYGRGRAYRLSEALTQLDQLSIFTIHGFCKRVLEDSALESGTSFDTGFIDDDALLIDSVTRDWWRRTIYDNAKLAALAVHDDWTYDSFASDLKKKRRWPDTRLDPNEPLDRALLALDGAIATFAASWNRAAAEDLLGSLAWLAPSFLRDAANRGHAADVATRLAGGDYAAASLVARELTTDALLDAKSGLQKKSRDAFLRGAHAFATAADAVAAALTRVRCAMRVSCLDNVERCLDAEKRRQNVLGFDDLLRRLHGALTEEGPDGHLALAIRSRYQVALIDEFQDTDPCQFPIFKTAFAGRPLFVIGDPKQAIFGFRGADIFAYMSAAKEAAHRYTLGNNWRSTRRMVAAVNGVFGRHPAAFLYEGVTFSPATAARALDDPLAGDGKASLHWWWIPPADKSGEPAAVTKSDATRSIYTALVSEIVRLLDTPTACGQRVTPGCIAVLVRSGYHGRDVRRALARAGVPCIIAGLGDVLTSDELRDLEWLLRAVAAPQNARAVRAALTTELWGFGAAEIELLSQAAHEDEWQRITDRFVAARESWAQHGFMRMIQELLVEHRVAERLLAHEDGERRLTNLRHAVELLHQTSVEAHLSPEALLLWIVRARIGGGHDAERTELRLESDDDAVQIVTIHKSKGLEYDIVFCPDLWEPKRASVNEPVLVHLPDGGIVFDHGSEQRAVRGRLEGAEQLAEDLRLMYVALTRARHRCYVAWGAIANGTSKVGASHSALGYLLRAEHAPGAPEDVAERTAAHLESSIGGWKATLDAMIANAGGTMSHETLSAGGFAPRWTPPAAAIPRQSISDPLPSAAQLRSWKISSFTSFTAGRHVDNVRDVADPGLLAAERVMRCDDRGDFLALPAGRQAGVALHEIFEHVDFAGDASAVRPLVSQTLLRARLAEDDSDARVDGVARTVARVLSAPLPMASFSLRDVPRTATLREWAFHVPLGPVSRDTFAPLFAQHGDDIARRYAPVLGGIDIDRVYGFLTGVVDLALQHDNRWYIVDWKSNHLGYAAIDYAQPALEAEMFRSHYVLQYHIYAAALHRFLRLRQPGYDYERHFGGVCYAFLRGADFGGGGWFADRPPRAIIDALDALLDAAESIEMGA